MRPESDEGVRLALMFCAVLLGALGLIFILIGLVTWST